MKKTIALILTLLMVFSLCACGAGAKSTAAMYDTAVPAEAPAAAYEMAEEESAYGLSSANGTADAMAGADDADLSASDTLDPEKIIYSANATVETTEFDKTIDGLNAMVSELGGFIESSSLSGSNYYSTSRGYDSNRYASYTIRIPSKYFSQMMNSLSTLGNVPYTYTYSENISAQYYDTKARLEAYQTQEDRLVEMMSVAETVEDIITIEDRLTELRYKIESLQSSLNNWDRQVSYSSINLEVQEVAVYTPETAMTYGDQLALAFKTGLENAGRFFRQLLIDVLSALPVLVFLVIVAVIVIVSVKKSRRKKAALAAAAENTDKK